MYGVKDKDVFSIFRHNRSLINSLFLFRGQSSIKFVVPLPTIIKESIPELKKLNDS